jgi:hypothetical protein
MNKTEQITAKQYQELIRKSPVDKKGRIAISKALPEYREKIIEPIFNKEVESLTIEIPFVLPTLNEYIQSERSHWAAAADLKKNATEAVIFACRGKQGIIDPNGLYDLEIHWIVPNNKSDSDNIFQGIKYILDGIVKAKIISNDGRKNVRNISHTIETVKEKYLVTVNLIKTNNQ